MIGVDAAPENIMRSRSHRFWAGREAFSLRLTSTFFTSHGGTWNVHFRAACKKGRCQRETPLIFVHLHFLHHRQISSPNLLRQYLSCDIRICFWFDRTQFTMPNMQTVNRQTLNLKPCLSVLAGGRATVQR